MKIALVHDYLKEYGGAERVLETIHSMWPDAPVYTAFVDWNGLGRHAERFKAWDVRTSWVQGQPFIKKCISPLRFLAPKIWESFDLSGYDLVITSSGWFIPRGVIVRGTHICYIHHPPRNLYGYATGSNLQKYPAVRAYTTFINFFLRLYDFKTAQKVDWFVANSKETARRVRKFYRRDSTVIYPPIAVPDIPKRKDTAKRTYYLSVSRLSYAKRIDLTIEAANKLHLPLVIVGAGKEEENLKKLAGPTVTFAGAVSDEKLGELYAGAKALIFCALDEDFGMVPVEAMAWGTPVVGLSQGGVAETVLDGKTGILFSEPSTDSLIDGICRFEKLASRQDLSDNCRKRARQFETDEFKRQLRKFVEVHRQKQPAE